MIIYLNPAFARPPDTLARIVMRRYPRIKRTGCPPSVLSCTAWGFSCRANYSARGELLPRLFNLTCTLLPKNRRCLFCDTFRRRNFATAAPACFTRHAAVWCSDFPPASLTTHQRSSAIGRILAHSGLTAFAGRHQGDDPPIPTRARRVPSSDRRRCNGHEFVLSRW
jgi:hypothetical protein